MILWDVFWGMFFFLMIFYEHFWFLDGFGGLYIPQGS